MQVFVRVKICPDQRKRGLTVDTYEIVALYPLN